MRCVHDKSRGPLARIADRLLIAEARGSLARIADRRSPEAQLARKPNNFRATPCNLPFYLDLILYSGIIFLGKQRKHLLFQKRQTAQIAPEKADRADCACKGRPCRLRRSRLNQQTAQNQSIITTDPNEVEGSEDKQRDERFDHK